MFKAQIAAVLLFMALVGLFGVCAASAPQSSASQTQPAKESWQTEFEDVCSKTQNAMTLSQDELTDLIRRCDALQPQIEKLNESQKKVFAGRLRMCRGLYAYVLDTKKNEKK